MSTSFRPEVGHLSPKVIKHVVERFLIKRDGFSGFDNSRAHAAQVESFDDGLLRIHGGGPISTAFAGVRRRGDHRGEQVRRLLRPVSLFCLKKTARAALRLRLQSLETLESSRGLRFCLSPLRKLQTHPDVSNLSLYPHSSKRRPMTEDPARTSRRAT